MPISLRHLTIIVLAVALAGCATSPPPVTGSAPADRFFAELQALCGQAFAGRITVDTPAATGPDPFAGKPLVMHVRGCSDHELRVPFHVGDDRSRTWVITRIDGPHGQRRLRLKHDHRHADGSDDATTMYGGDSVAAGSVQRQEFPVDDFSKAMFVREGPSPSVSNTWAMELQPGQQFVYELARPGGRLFRVEFDLSRPIATPPAPWGAED